MQKTKHVHCIFILYSNHSSWSHQSIFWLKAIYLRFGRRKSWLVPVQYLIGKLKKDKKKQYLIGKRLNKKTNNPPFHSLSHHGWPLLLLNRLIAKHWLEDKRYCDRERDITPFFLFFYIYFNSWRTLSPGIMMIVVSQFVQSMLGDNPDNPEVILNSYQLILWYLVNV